ncbi:MAG: hypothetical protein CMH93_04560 [Oceanicaulis sp.]|uniref:Flavodoxin-like domain-containing protein n=1 Tax=Maricaulis virginensis TaxID=144022 RepID=A0A9W6IHW4_9PROT|nr:hypothetical protein [Maricaulis virginensis]MAC38788.1 hypothetical protein [Oceanicaulis sp.]GLK50611.1 hypothetical protein GCM10017621_01190 [Maricaulis virginensis]
MKTLVVYYSLTGTTRAVAEMIADQMNADLAEIGCTRYGRSAWGMIRAVYDSLRNNLPPIEPLARNVTAYDLVVVGGPIWASHPAPPVRRFLRQTVSRLPRTAVFLTHQGSPAEGALAEMEDIIGKSAAATLVARKADLDEPVMAEKVAAFALVLERHAGSG